MDVSRTGSGGTNRNTAVIRHIKIRFQRYPGTTGSDADRGIAGVPYTIKVNGAPVATGTSATDGLVEADVPSGSTVTLEILGATYTLNALGAIELKTTVKGVQRRLTQLGYDLGGIDGIIGQHTDAALLQFQADNGFDPTGGNTAQTQNQLATQLGD